eukprot:CAMPEP_0202892670 /NCGR_PEP_ID=MMETSP1392-20130828/2380_1 /ASSEMBLY_ACC=CAM_ASM_000868 /TAXON_ID=225041 /ORGANISM="Chlamydomonas chlamydogama, Strain SAG 11-48b" /LENGTH=75 /DNA_ID=CAMNT_0049576715 /DNA_START=314 /DNA_END=541 /DNA_ORIENTATION=+
MQAGSSDPAPTPSINPQHTQLPFYEYKRNAMTGSCSYACRVRQLRTCSTVPRDWDLKRSRDYGPCITAAHDPAQA